MGRSIHEPGVWRRTNWANPRFAQTVRLASGRGQPGLAMTPRISSASNARSVVVRLTPEEEEERRVT